MTVCFFSRTYEFLTYLLKGVASLYCIESLDLHGKLSPVCLIRFFLYFPPFFTSCKLHFDNFLLLNEDDDEVVDANYRSQTTEGTESCHRACMRNGRRIPDPGQYCAPTQNSVHKHTFTENTISVTYSSNK